jgi:hypothetical protein
MYIIIYSLYTNGNILSAFSTKVITKDSIKSDFQKILFSRREINNNLYSYFLLSLVICSEVQCPAVGANSFSRSFRDCFGMLRSSSENSAHRSNGMEASWLAASRPVNTKGYVTQVPSDISGRRADDGVLRPLPRFLFQDLSRFSPTYFEETARTVAIQLFSSLVFQRKCCTLIADKSFLGIIILARFSWDNIIEKTGKIPAENMLRYIFLTYEFSNLYF